MPKIERYILAQLIGLFGFFSLILVLIYWINTAAQLFDRVIADGLSGLVFFEFSALALPNIIFLVAPASAMVAVVYCMNQLGADRALNILRATGYSGRRLALPFTCYGGMVFLALLALSHFLVPLSGHYFQNRQADLATVTTARLFTEGSFVHPVDNVSFYIRDIQENGELRNIFLEDNRGETAKITYTAQRAFLVKKPQGPQLVMVQGKLQYQNKKTGNISLTKFNDFVFDITDFSGGPSAQDVNLKRLVSTEILRNKNFSLFEKWHEIFFRTLVPFNAFATIVLAFAAMNAGAFSRFGMWRNILWAGGTFVGIKVLEAMSFDLVERTQSLMWMTVPGLIGFAITIAALTFADRPWLKVRSVAE